jgi:hypothetical protein
MHLRKHLPKALKVAGVLGCLAWSDGATATTGEHLLFVDPFSANANCLIDPSGNDLYFVEGHGYDSSGHIVCETSSTLYPYSYTFTTAGSNCPPTAVSYSASIVLRNFNTMAVVKNVMESSRQTVWGGGAQVGPFNVPPTSNCPNGATLAGVAVGHDP